MPEIKHRPNNVHKVHEHSAVLCYFDNYLEILGRNSNTTFYTEGSSNYPLVIAQLNFMLMSIRSISLTDHYLMVIT
jgi:hypothetical protein